MIRRGVRFLPAAILAMAVSRAVADFWAAPPALVGLALLGLLAALARSLPLRLTWPWLLTGAYLLYPEPDPVIAGVIFAGSATVTAFAVGMNRAWPLPSERQVGMALFVGLLGLYAGTAASGVLPADNGEFQLVAATFGVAHPPGFPLYSMLAGLVGHLPLGSGPAERVNLLSALIAATTAVWLYAAILRLTRQRVAALVGSLALAIAPAFWAQAGVAGIRGLTAFFTAWAVYGLVGLWLDRESAAGVAWRPLAHFSFALALGVGHHPSLVFIGLVWLAGVVLALPAWRMKPRQLAVPLAAASVALLPLAYLPLRAGAWGGYASLTTWSGFGDHILARGFAGDFFYFTDAPVLWQRLRIVLDIMAAQFGVGLLGLTLIGWLLLGRRFRGLALAVGLGIAVHMLVTATYRAPQTTEYMMPAYVVLAFLLGCAVAWAPTLLPTTWQHAGRALLAGILLTITAAAGAARLPNFASDVAAADTFSYTQAILTEAPPGALVLANWHWVTPLWYAQRVQGSRPDLTIEYVAPGEAPYGQSWAERVETGLASGRDVIATWWDEAAYATLPAPEPLGEAFWFRQAPRTALSAEFTPLDVALPEIRVAGVRYSAEPMSLDGAISVTVAWLPLEGSGEAIGLYLHLLDGSGRLMGQADLTVTNQPAGLTLTRFTLTPRPGAAPGEHRLLFGVAGTEAPQIDLGTVTLTPMIVPPVSANPTYRLVSGDGHPVRLVGYDWDTTLGARPRLYLHWKTEAGYQTEVRDNVNPGAPGLPACRGAWGRWQPMRLEEPNEQTYVPLGAGIVLQEDGFPNLETVSADEVLVIEPLFASQAPVMRDLVVSVRLVGYEEDGFRWAWWDLDDWVPALGAYPTLKWIGGSRVRDPHLVQVPPAAPEGQQIGALLRVYDAFTGRPLPILDEDLAAQAVWIPLGETTVR
jgi:hypothetical protein